MSVMEELHTEKQQAIEKTIEEVTQQKYDRIAEIKSDFEFVIKRLENAKNKDTEKISKKKQERDSEIVKLKEEMEKLKKTKIEQIN